MTAGRDESDGRRPPPSEVHARRLGAQWLSGPPARDPVSVVGHLLAIQSQDLRGARLAIRARSTGLSTADVDRALTEDRSLVVTWLNRGTLHLVRAEDYRWLHALVTAPVPVPNGRRLHQLGVSVDAAERGLGVIGSALEADGPLTRDELAHRLASADVPTAGQAVVHLLYLASHRGLIVRGPVLPTGQAFVRVDQWLPPGRPVDREVARAELVRRYLAGHGPAGDRDLAYWSGLGLTEVRAGLTSIAGELRQGPAGLVDLVRRPRRRRLPPPKLLGPFDPVLFGWRSRDDLVGQHGGIVTVNGVFRAIAVVGGRAVATWTMAGPRVVLERLAPIGEADERALEVEAADVARYLGPSVSRGAARSVTADGPGRRRSASP